MEKIEMTTKNGMKFTVSFSDNPADYQRLAKFLLLLADSKKIKD